MVFSNFRVIKRYNNATSYAMAVGHLADRIRDQGHPLDDMLNMVIHVLIATIHAGNSERRQCLASPNQLSLPGTQDRDVRRHEWTSIDPGTGLEQLRDIRESEAIALGVRVRGFRATVRAVPFAATALLVHRKEFARRSVGTA